MLEFSQVSKYFSDHQVLDHINLKIQKGQTTGLIGANGEGKTTLFKCLLNACQTDGGSIRIFDTPHTQIEARFQLSFLPEHFQAPFYLKAQEFLKLMLELQQTHYSQSKVEAILSALLFDLKMLNKPVKTFSKGMMQKLGLTACLCSDKPLLILDEPMSGLDPSARYALKQLLIDQKQQGKTLVFSTHLLHDIESICDSIAILCSGEIHFQGTVQEALNQFEANSLEQAYLHCLKTTYG